MRLLLLICLFLTSACAASLPNSEQLELVKAAREEPLKQLVSDYGLEYGSPVFIRVFKQEEQLEVWMKDKEYDHYVLFASYPICEFSGELGPKLYEGDKQAPEGFYTVTADGMNPWSRHQLSFNIGYPNKYDEAYGRTGSLIMIHGGCTSIGCYAMTDPAVEEIYLLVEASIKNGANVPVHIFPFRMNGKNMTMAMHHEWFPFWVNLKDGYDAFELYRIPPTARHEDGKYVFQTPTKNYTAF
ncbi:MAG: murein L,D-transpeptidase [Alphaproteobacteria bacterium]|nr:murein L,D-transpeptidase [Alphaproteobacteria bacterium]